jgi:hypothetical protein
MADIEDLLKALQEADPEELKKFANSMTVSTKTKTKQVSVPHGPVKSFTTVVTNYECKLCGSKFSKPRHLEKGEIVNAIDTTGENHPLKVTGQAGTVYVNSFVSRCQYCEEVVKTWSREKLEQSFLALSRSCTFKEVHNYTMTE